MILKQKKKPLYLKENLDYLLKLHDLDIKNLSIETGIPAATLARMKKKGFAFNLCCASDANIFTWSRIKKNFL